MSKTMIADDPFRIIATIDDIVIGVFRKTNTLGITTKDLLERNAYHLVISDNNVLKALRDVINLVLHVGDVEALKETVTQLSNINATLLDIKKDLSRIEAKYVRNI